MISDWTVIVENNLASSTSRSISTVLSKIDGKSFIESINNRGPKREPCGPPELT